MSNQVTNDKAASLAATALTRLSHGLTHGDSDALKNYLAFTARFHQYSFRNQLLILFQNPDSTFVAGFQKWTEMRRWVKRGEKGMAILVPITHKRKTENQEGSDDKSEEPSRVEERLVGFTTGYVFDIAQTDGEPLPEFRTPRGHPVTYLETLIKLTASMGIKLSYAQNLGGARGLSKGNAIVLLDGMMPAEEFQVLCHELAHEMLHKGERRIQTTKQIRELEAEAVAYAVGSAIGLECECSFDYIRLYKGDEKMLSQSLHHIQRTASEILSALFP